MPRVGYPSELRESIMKRFQSAHAPRIHDLSRETGISHTTLYKWRKYATSSHHPEQCSPQLRSAEDKWRLITQAYELEGQELGAFLRQEGVYLAQLDEWRADIMRALNPMSKKRDMKRKKEKAVANQVKQLKAELKRKDVALAEAAALLLLSKKAEALWEEEDANTTLDNDSGSSK